MLNFEEGGLKWKVRFLKTYNNLKLHVPGFPIRGTVQLRIIPDKENGLAEIRFWYEDKLVGI